VTIDNPNNDEAVHVNKLKSELLSSNKQLNETAQENHLLEAQSMVKSHAMVGLAAGFIPIPFLDIAALSAAQLHLLRDLSLHYNVEFEEKSAKSILTALMSGALPVLGLLGLSSMFKFIPGIGTLGGGASLAISASATIYSTGQVFIKHFGQGGTLQNFDAKHAIAFFKEEIEQGKKIVENLRKQ